MDLYFWECLREAKPRIVIKEIRYLLSEKNRL